MLKQNLFLYRFIISFLMVSLFALGCGDKSEKAVKGFDLNSLNLSQDTIAVQVALPSTQQEIQQVSTGAGTFKNRFNAPLSFDQIQMIRAIVVDRSGSKHLMGAATFSQKLDGSSSRAISGTIDSIGLNDVIWISDLADSNMFFAYIQFFQNPSIEIGVDLFNGGSLTLANLIEAGAIDITAPIRIYFHFEKK